jgi:hypothetical protein
MSATGDTLMAEPRLLDILRDVRYVIHESLPGSMLGIRPSAYLVTPDKSSL